MNKQEQKEQFLALRIAGDTFESIASKLGVSKQTLINWSKDMEIKESIDIARTTRYQSILNQYEATKSDKIEFYSFLSQKVKDELRSIDLSKMRPEKLLDVLIKCDARLSDLIKGKNFGGGNPFDEFLAEDPSFYFNPEE
jgi:DNA-binding XRE family transcriptional regulator